jgi:Short C-terminal domain
LGAKPSNLQIVGIALVLFSGVLLGVGIHHLVATGTCSSTGYSANYGPVPTCPAGTGWWFAFVFLGILGGVAGALMATNLGLVFAVVFGAIGFGALSLLLDSSTSSGTKVFAAIFGGTFALVGVSAAIGVLGSVLGSLRRSPKPAATRSDTAKSAFGTPQAASAFGDSSSGGDAILSAYNASRSPAPTVSVAGTPPAGAAGASASQLSPVNLVPGLQAAQRAAAKKDPLDELGKLADLHKSGALSEEEFATAKAKLLGEV